MSVSAKKTKRRSAAPSETKAAVVPSITSAPEEWFLNLAAGRATSAGLRVGPRTAMRTPAVKRAVDLIGSTLGTLPVRVYALSDNEARTLAPKHPAFGLVYRNANAWTSARKFRETLTRDALLHGNGFAYVNRLDGRLRELIHLEPGAVSVDLDLNTREPFYRATVDGVSREFTWRDILHVAAPTLDGVQGASPVILGREAIGLSLALEGYASRLWANGARPGGVISVKGKLGQDAASRIKKSWDATFGGEGTGGTAVLEEGAEYDSVTLTSVDAEFMAQRRHQVREIANVFGLPSTMLGDTENATYSNVEGLAQSFRDETILPWVATWEDAYARVLLDEDERATHAILFDLDALDRADLAAKSDAMAKRRAAGVTTANDERRTLNLPDHANGNELGSPYTTANTAPAGKAPENV